MTGTGYDVEKLVQVINRCVGNDEGMEGAAAPPDQTATPVSQPAAGPGPGSAPGSSKLLGRGAV